ncbi:dihydroorotase [Fundidesulfovibrio putealis]|uniref:dihydroorotase n=1 Tax=Fundidesulfovibrio putealis TaxID=270496 RepID=UPI000405B641|nr:dihydroorotase [Fundidesulfovibrio putealis]
MSQADLVVRGAALAESPQAPVDLFAAKGRILALVPAGTRPVPEGAKVVEAEGMLLLPGLTDVHVHLREPGQEWKETIATGLSAAAKGGFVNVMCMANTDPVNDQASITETMLDKAAKSHPRGPRLFPVGALTLGLEGKSLAPLEELRAAGCKAYSNDGRPVADSELFRRALEYASDLGIPVIDHCEDPYLAPGAGVNEGEVSARLGLRGAPACGEAIQVARDCLLAQYLGVPIHLAHISSKMSVDVIREAKAKGAPVTAETCPHYLILTEEACEDYDTAAKVNPPLRTRADQQALLAALEDGTIDVLATDHAPHASHEKETPFDEAPNGISGLETALSVTWELVARGELSARTLVSAWCVRPAEIFALPLNRFQEGDPADFILFDPSARWTVTPKALASKGKNTPLMGRELTGVVRAAYVAGKNAL